MLTPPHHRHDHNCDNTERSRMNTVTSNDNTRIAFDQSGEGPALILVAPAFATRADQAALAAALAPSLPCMPTTGAAVGTAPTPRPTPSRVRSTTLTP